MIVVVLRIKLKSMSMRMRSWRWTSLCLPWNLHIAEMCSSKKQIWALSLIAYMLCMSWQMHMAPCVFQLFFLPVFCWIWGHLSTCCKDKGKTLVGVRTMVAEIQPRLATNIIFTTVLVSLLTWKYQFMRLQIHHFISAT